jgi:hypothetical protein
MAGSDKVKGNCLGSFYNFIYEEGKGAPEQNYGAGEQSRGSQSEFYFTRGKFITDIGRH